MAITNYEFKARASDTGALEAKLLELGPRFVGEDHQIDTYFNVPNGRLKLREGNIENALVHYERADKAGAKESRILLYEHEPDPVIKQIMSAALGVMAVVDKRRRIYFIDNVKFHFDRLDGFGSFVEVEAIDRDGSIGIDSLRDQCRKYAELFGIAEADYVSESYSDMVMRASANV